MSTVLPLLAAGVLLLLELLLVLLLLPHAASATVEPTTAPTVINFPRELIILLCSTRTLGWVQERRNLVRPGWGDKVHVANPRRQRPHLTKRQRTSRRAELAIACAVIP
jgi:hypothetical protein